MVIVISSTEKIQLPWAACLYTCPGLVESVLAPGNTKRQILDLDTYDNIMHVLLDP